MEPRDGPVVPEPCRLSRDHGPRRLHDPGGRRRHRRPPGGYGERVRDRRPPRMALRAAAPADLSLPAPRPPGPTARTRSPRSPRDGSSRSRTSICRPIRTARTGPRRRATRGRARPRAHDAPAGDPAGARRAPRLADAGMPVFLTGDFNSPSHLDWTPAVDAVREEVRYPVVWPVSAALADAGFVIPTARCTRTPWPSPGSPGLHPGRSSRCPTRCTTGSTGCSCRARRDARYAAGRRGRRTGRRHRAGSVSDRPPRRGVDVPRGRRRPAPFAAAGARRVFVGGDLDVRAHGPGSRVVLVRAGQGPAAGAGLALPRRRVRRHPHAPDGNVVTGAHEALLVDASDAVLSRSPFWVYGRHATEPADLEGGLRGRGADPRAVAGRPGYRFDWMGVFSPGRGPAQNAEDCNAGTCGNGHYLPYDYTETLIQGSALIGPASFAGYTHVALEGGYGRDPPPHGRRLPPRGSPTRSRSCTPPGTTACVAASPAEEIGVAATRGAFALRWAPRCLARDHRARRGRADRDRVPRRTPTRPVSGRRPTPGLLRRRSKWRKVLPFLPLLAAVGCLVYAFSGFRLAVREASPVIVLVLDVSDSMNATDVAPDRLSPLRPRRGRSSTSSSRLPVGLTTFASGAQVVVLPRRSARTWWTRWRTSPRRRAP